MKKFLITMTLVTLMGCQTTQTVYTTDEHGNQVEQLPPSAFANFTDIPTPDRATMNLDKTVVLGSGEDWTGKLSFNSPHAPSSVFDFFVEEMPKRGWKETATVRAEVSFLTYSRRGREAIIQIYGDSDDTTVDLMVSPQRRTQ